MANPVPLKNYLVDQLWGGNQILVAILGICSALAVTNSMQVSITMGVAVTLVTGFSSLFVSMIRKITPDSVRMITQLAIISLFVTIVDQFLRAFDYDMSKKLSVFVGLIITNCIVMGRTEAMAKNVAPIPAFLDGIGAGMGYAIVLLFMGVIRESLGLGTLLGHQVIPESWYATPQNPDGYSNFGLMVVAPAAFFILGFMVWMVNKINKRTES